MIGSRKKRQLAGVPVPPVREKGGRRAVLRYGSPAAAPVLSLDFRRSAARNGDVSSSALLAGAVREAAAAAVLPRKKQILTEKPRAYKELSPYGCLHGGSPVRPTGNGASLTGTRACGSGRTGAWSGRNVKGKSSFGLSICDIFRRKGDSSRGRSVRAG